MNSEKISYEKAGMLARITRDYIAGKPDLKSFYRFTPDIQGLEKAIKARKGTKINREITVDRLLHQYENIECSELTRSNIKSLNDENTFTVTTGHQLNLFTGPLYFIWKILSTIKLAETLNEKYPENKFIPVYWLASEDHDFKEIDHAHVFDKKYSWNTSQTGAVGRFDPSPVLDVIDRLEDDLGGKFPDGELVQKLREAYSRPVHSEAVRCFVNELFKDRGLVIIDGDDARLKAEFKSIIKSELVESKANALIEETAGKLGESGYKKQVTPREINLFYMKDGVRARIVKSRDRYSVTGTDIEFDRDSVLDEVESHPQRFSPNVVLRPMYQEIVLPNIAYLGGGAEVAYWLELRSAFEHYGVFFPVVLLRNSVLVLTEKARKKMRQLDLKTGELFLSERELSKKAVIDASGDTLNFREEKERLKRIFEEIKKRMAETDETLRSSAEAARVKHIHYIENLEKKLLRAEKKKNKTAIERIKALKGEVEPGGIPQERYANYVQLAAEFGADVIESVYEHIDPLDCRLTVLK